MPTFLDFTNAYSSAASFALARAIAVGSGTGRMVLLGGTADTGVASLTGSMAGGDAFSVSAGPTVSAANSSVNVIALAASITAGASSQNATLSGAPDGQLKWLNAIAVDGASSLRSAAVLSSGSAANPSTEVTTSPGDLVVFTGNMLGVDRLFTPASGTTKIATGGNADFACYKVAGAGTTTSIGGIFRDTGDTFDNPSKWNGAVYVLAGSASPVITGPTGAAGAGSITHTVNENSNAAGTWTATDAGAWSLTGTDAADLSISGGVVTKASGNFDFETKASYSFNVVSGSASQAVTLSITNLPELSVPTKSTPSSTTAVVGATVDLAAGTLYAVLTLDNSPPSAVQVEAGQDSAGSSATTVAPAALTITSTGAKSFAAATVVSGTTRYGWIVHKNGGVYSTVLATGPMYPGTGRTVSDVLTAGWTASTGSNLAAMLDEDVADDADYITSPTLSGSASVAEFALDKTYGAGTYSIKVRASVNVGAGTLRVRMLNGSDVSQGVTSDQAINTTPTTYTLPITITGDATRIQIEVLAA